MTQLPLNVQLYQYFLSLLCYGLTYEPVCCDLIVSCREQHERWYIELVLEALSASSDRQQFQNQFFSPLIDCPPLLLLQVRDVWQSYELELVNYQNKCRIIRGWDDLFTKVKEHINSVSAMKLSPYYKVHWVVLSRILLHSQSKKH